MHPRSIPGADKFARFGVEKMQCIAMPFSVCFEKALYLLEISFAFSFFRRHSRSEFYSFNHHRALIGEQLKSPQLQLRPASPSFAQLRPASPSFAAQVKSFCCASGIPFGACTLVPPKTRRTCRWTICRGRLQPRPTPSQRLASIALRALEW